MRYCLASYVGTGTGEDPFRPQGSDDASGWSAIDLRPDSTKADGLAVIACPTAVGTDLGDDPYAPLPASTRGLLGNRLGLNLKGESAFLTHASPALRPKKWSVAALLVELLRDHAKKGTRWDSLGSSQGWMEILLGGGVLWRAPVVLNTTITEDFNTADTGTLGPDLTWTEVAGVWEVFSNSATANSGTVLISARAEHNLATANHYAQAVCSSSVGNSSRGGVATRFDPAAETYYAFFRSHTAPNGNRIAKMVAGTQTNLASDTTNAIASGSVLKLRTTGSSLTGYDDGVSYLAVTDTSITGNLRTGIVGMSNGGNRRFTIDDFEASDIAATTARLASYHYRRRRVMA